MYDIVDTQHVQKTLITHCVTGQGNKQCMNDVQPEVLEHFWHTFGTEEFKPTPSVSVLGRLRGCQMLGGSKVTASP